MNSILTLNALDMDINERLKGLFASRSIELYGNFSNYKEYIANGVSCIIGLKQQFESLIIRLRLISMQIQRLM